MADIKQVRISGFGGQGVVLAGVILGHAATEDGKWVSGSNSYGPEARGGSCKTEVVISDQPIKFPHVIRSDILISLSQSAYEKYIEEVCEDGAVVIYDDLLVKPSELKGADQIGVPATDKAIEQLDNKQAANIVILAASVALTDIVSKQALTASVSKNIEERFKALNLKALEVGYQLGEQIKNR